MAEGVLLPHWHCLVPQTIQAWREYVYGMAQPDGSVRSIQAMILYCPAHLQYRWKVVRAGHRQEGACDTLAAAMAAAQDVLHALTTEEVPDG